MNRIRGVIAFSLLGFSLAGCEAKKAAAPPPKPEKVTVSQPVYDTVTDFEDFTGRTDAVFTVEVRARVTGYLDKVLFKDGDEVKEDDPLFEIDPRPYKHEYDRTEAALAQAEAHLKRLEADYKRAANLFARGNIAREEFDRIFGDRNEAEAAVGSARASFDMAKLNLGFTKINAPISGRLSRRLVDPGNLVKADETMLTTIVSLDPMYAYFDVDERTLLRLRRLVSEGKMPSRQQGAQVGVLIALGDEETPTHEGEINFSDNKLDPGTGTLRVRASLPNPADSKKVRLLQPGLFVRVRLPVGKPHRSLMIPEKALGTEQGEKYLYVVDKQNKVKKRPVKVGRLDGKLRVIESGLEPSELVVVEGLQRVRPDAEVIPVPERLPSTPPSKTGTAANSVQPPRRG
jgi:RND family efflux transporter MFP subunit